jgi:hypothetical protein
MNKFNTDQDYENDKDEIACIIKSNKKRISDIEKQNIILEERIHRIDFILMSKRRFLVFDHYDCLVARLSSRAEAQNFINGESDDDSIDPWDRVMCTIHEDSDI